MIGRYPTIKLGQIARVRGGKRVPLGDALIAEQTPYPYIRARDIGEGVIRFDDPVYLIEATFKKISHYTVETNDVCVTIVGANVGDVGIVPASLSGANLTENAAKLTELRDYDPFFLKYSLLSPHCQAQMKLFAGGAAQPKLGIYKINEVEVPYPSLPVQIRIAGILLAYDSLIENNLRRMKILEEMAQALYREWFEEFRFPGHEKIEIVESNFGKQPDSWPIRRIDEICEYISRGVTPTYQEGSGRYIINQKANRGAYIARTELKELDPELPVPDEKLAIWGDLLVNCLGEGTLGRVHFFVGPTKAWAVDQHMTICRASKAYATSYLYMVLSSRDGQARIQALKTGGTNMTMFNISALRAFEVAYPDQSLLDLHYEFMKPVWKLRSDLDRANMSLRQTRDLLLPKLISGEIDVEKLDIHPKTATADAVVATL